MSMPFTVSRIPVDKDGKPTFDPHRASEVYQSVKGIRGRIIEAALRVETDLTATILCYLVGGQNSVQNKLREFIFDAEFCTFMQKRKMLSKIFDIDGSEINYKSAIEAKQLRRCINEIILVRNKYAHGEIVVDCTDYKPYIKYYSNGTQEELIDPEIVQEFEMKCLRIHEELSELFIFFKEKDISA